MSNVKSILLASLLAVVCTGSFAQELISQAHSESSDRNSSAAMTAAYMSIRHFGITPENDPQENARKLQAAIDWASPRGAALFVEPSEEPYPIASGITLKANVSLIGVHGPVGRGTQHPGKKQPVGSVFKIQDKSKPFITVQDATQLRGIQFWYPDQTVSDPAKVIEYPPTIQVDKTRVVQGVTLSCLTFYGEFIAMDFNSPAPIFCEQILFEHLYGYPLSGEFIRIDRCYDIPRLLHCHVNPATMRMFAGQFSKSVVDSVVARKTFTYKINNTDNAQLMDVFTFGVYGGVYLGAATYGQMTNFNLDCVTVGIHKLGDNTFNRNWQIAQGSIIANLGEKVEDIHPIVIEGAGHTAISNVEAFSGPNAALSVLGSSLDFLLVQGDQKPTISLFGCRMRNYTADSPITLNNKSATIRALACFDKNEQLFELAPAK